MTDTTKPKSAGDLETEAMDFDENERLPQEITMPTTNAVGNSGFSVWCKGNGLTDQVVQTLQDAGFRTPKDLMDREDDVYGLKDLSGRDCGMLGGAIRIERMRNASASNSVDNAALGLTTQDSAAGGNAPTDAQRAAELDKQIKEAFEKYRLENTLEWQRKSTKLPCGELKSALPYYQGQVQFVSATRYFGEACNNLADLVHGTAFATDPQQRMPIAIVQAFGCGKTRTALQLTFKGYAVLPLPLTKDHPLIVTLIDAQTTELKNLKERTASNIKKFSKSCLRLARLPILALYELFKHCVEKKFMNPLLDEDRHALAVLLQCQARPLVDWMTAYFKNKQQEILGMEPKDFKELVKNAATDESSLRIVFVLDEAHGVRKKCRGFCLHKKSSDVDKTLVENWEAELNFKAATVTNLLYQLRRVIIQFHRNVNNRFGFILCSTMFKVWNTILELDSPANRGQTKRFYELHWFSMDEVKAYIHHYFDVGALLEGEHEKQLQKFRRPSFVADLLQVLAQSATASKYDVKTWLDRSIKRALDNAVTVTDEKVRLLVNTANEMILQDYSARRLVFSAYVIDKLCGGALDLRSEIVVELINSGVVRLSVLASGEVTCDDPFFIEAVNKTIREKLEEGPHKAMDPVIHEVLSPAIINLIDDQSAKGKAAERIIAWLALRDGLQVTTDNRTFRFYPGVALTSQSGTTKQFEAKLQKKHNAADFVWQVMTNSDRRLLFPEEKCGPDLLFRQHNGAGHIVAIQCKMYSERGNQAQSSHNAATAVGSRVNSCGLAEFNKALFSLHPAYYFKEPKDESDNDRMTAERQRWLTHASEVTGFTFQRIVFVALGFALHVQYLVQEYNAAQQQRGSQGLIHLLSLHDLKQQIDEQNYADLVKTLSANPSEKLNVQAHEPVTLQSKWKADRQMMKPDKLKGRAAEEFEAKLKRLCDERNINVTKEVTSKYSKKYSTQKTPADMIADLDAYDIQKVLAALNWSLP